MRGDRMKQVREALHYTQEELAERAGLQTLQIWRYESGKSKPNSDVLSKIAQALNVSADFLLGLTDEPHGHISDDLTDSERLVIEAWRRGDFREAIKTIVIND